MRTLLRLVRTFGRLSDGYGRVFAVALNAGKRPFHVVNHLGSCAGAVVFHGPRLVAKFDRTIAIASLERHLDEVTDAAPGRTMHFPVDWDPHFADRITLADVYHYGTQHFDHHARQPTWPRVPENDRRQGGE